MYPNHPLKQMGIGLQGINISPMWNTKWNTHLQNIQVAHVNGHYEGIFASIEMLLFSWSPMLPKKMSLIIVEHGSDLIV
jgi:hypothetical protein